jgi:hypothetical protein
MSRSISTTNSQIISLFAALTKLLSSSIPLTKTERTDMLTYQGKLLKAGGALLTHPGTVTPPPVDPPPVDPPVTLPALVITPVTASAQVDVAANTQFAALSAVPAGATRTISPADGRVVLNAAKTAVVRGASSASVGASAYTITDTHPNATNSPRSAGFSMTFTAVPVVEPPITLPPITATPASASVPTDVADGTILTTLSAVPAGATRTVTPDDGRVVFNGAKTALVRGSAAVSAGSTAYTVADTLEEAVNSPNTVGFALTFTAVVVDPPVDPPSDPLPAGSYDPALFVAKSIPTTPTAGVIYAPIMQQRASAGDLQGFGFTANASIPARQHAWGLLLQRGLHQPGEGMAYRLDGTDTPVQVDVKSTHDDGSSKHVLLAGAAPAVTGLNVSRKVMLKKAAAPTGSNVDVMTANVSMFGGSLTVVNGVAFGTYTDDIYTDNGAVTAINQTFDISPATMRSASAPKYWRQGPLCTEARFTKSILGAIRVMMNLRAHASGAVALEYEFDATKNLYNDGTAQASWHVTGSLTHSGTTVFSFTNLRFARAQTFRKVLYSDLTPTQNALSFPPLHEIQVDAPLWAQQGWTAPYGYDVGLNETAAAAWGSLADTAGFRAPLSNANIDKFMGGTGERPDLGILTGVQADWLMTGDSRIWKVVIAQSEASGAIPWGHHDSVNNRPLNSLPGVGYPGMWMDYRGQPGQLNVNPPNTQISDTGCTGWKIDMAHQPQLTFLAYVLTGSMWLRDRVEQFACFSVMDTEPNRRTRDGQGNDQLICQGYQVREAGWRLRDVAVAVNILDDASVVREPLRNLLKINTAYLVGKQAAWQAGQGNVVFGAHAGCESDPVYDLKRWMDDHLVAGLYCAWAMAGCVDAATHLAWKANFHLGMFRQADYPLKKATWYVRNVSDIKTPNFNARTWAALAAVTYQNDDDGGWEAGNYVQLGLRSASLISMATGNDVSDIIAAHVSGGAPRISAAGLRAGAIDNIRPLTRAA